MRVTDREIVGRQPACHRWKVTLACGHTRIRYGKRGEAKFMNCRQCPTPIKPRKMEGGFSEQCRQHAVEIEKLMELAPTQVARGLVRMVADQLRTAADE